MSEIKPKLLIVEDDFDNQNFLNIFLSRFFDVYICDSEKSFYKAIESQKYDIFLMDISLRGTKNGLELATELRLLPGYEKIPIVCLTAHAFQRDKENAIKAGMDIFLTKPVENELLMSTLTGLVKQH